MNKYPPGGGYLLQWNLIHLSDCYRHAIRLLRTSEAIISYIRTKSQLLPFFPVKVLKSQGIVLRKRKKPIIGKLALWWKCIILCSMVISCMFLLSTVQVISGSNLENVSPLGIHVVSYIQPFLVSLCHFFTSFLKKKGDFSPFFSLFGLSLLN